MNFSTRFFIGIIIDISLYQGTSGRYPLLYFEVSLMYLVSILKTRT